MPNKVDTPEIAAIKREKIAKADADRIKSGRMFSAVGSKYGCEPGMPLEDPNRRPKLIGTPFKTPLWCPARKHALKRDNKATPAFAMYIFLRSDRLEGRDIGCKFCEDAVPAENDSPFAFELMLDIEPPKRKPLDMLMIAEINGWQVIKKDWKGGNTD